MTDREQRNNAHMTIRGRLSTFCSWAVATTTLLTACALAVGQVRIKPIPRDHPFTFAVMGDNRGDSHGNQFPIFHRIIRRLNIDSPAFVFSTGDLINGYKEDEEASLRQMWNGYKRAARTLRMPIFNVPGNHDVFDGVSKRLWNEYLGPAYYSFDQGSARFIALDTETEPGRLSIEQFQWLEKQLAEGGDRNIFVFCHKPLFPVDGHIGSSLDEYPLERDRLHALFVRYKKNIKGVFQGHEHLYSFEERDGIPYYITGGAGAELYVPPELGGFYHYLLVKVDSGKVQTTVKRIRIRPHVSKAAYRVPPNSLLEDWSHPLFWYTWKEPISKELTKQYFTDGSQGIKVWLDFALHEYPVLYAPVHTGLDLSKFDSLSWDVFVPGKLGKRITATLSINEKYGAKPVALKSGWNRVVTGLASLSLPEAVMRGGVIHLQWTLHSNDKKLNGWVVFDNLRAHKLGVRPTIPLKSSPKSVRRAAHTKLIESWEGNLLWGTSDETVIPESATGPIFEGRKALKIRFDFSKYQRPAIFAAFDQSWNLTSVSSLIADVYAPPGVAGKLSLNFVASSGGNKYKSPAVLLSPGWNKITIGLENSWLPLKARRSVEQIEWRLSSPIKGLSGWLAFDDLRSGEK